MLFFNQVNSKLTKTACFGDPCQDQQLNKNARFGNPCQDQQINKNANK